MLLVEIAERQCVREKLIEALDALSPHALCQRDRRGANFAESLNRVGLGVAGV